MQKVLLLAFVMPKSVLFPEKIFKNKKLFGIVQDDFHKFIMFLVCICVDGIMFSFVFIY